MTGERMTPLLEPDPLWYKDAVIYEVHVRAFLDSDGDGVGDFRGLTQKLDYLQDLGVTAIWLLPFYPSPLRDDGYDIADYLGVHAAYGTRRDFRTFLREAHRRGLRVITELILNHTSDQHPWFQRARRGKPGGKARGFYVWSDTAEAYRDARVIFKDFEPANWAWDPVAKAYYWHRFYSHQPDLNFDNPAVRRAMLEVVDFWLGLGVDGLRLDAVPYLFEREGTSCENLPETHEFLRDLRAHVDAQFADRMLLAEANQWPEDAAAYFGQGNECHVAFHFPLMPRLFMAVRMEDRFPIIDILEQTPPIPEACQWALFLRNHDELTLEMVTDEDRDYMYRVYAHDPEARINLGIRRRLAPLLGNHRRKVELLQGLLLSLPGTPVLYFGDEIGMGDNIYLGDRNGVRTPMHWSSDRNAGFSRANPQKLYLPVIIDPEYHYEAVNVEAQQNNPHSLLWWMKRLIALRKRFRAFSRGSLEFLYPDNHKVLAFVRSYEDERILIVANLSRFVQSVEIDLSAFEGTVPVELFGRTRFPAIGGLPYFLTLGPHSFYWFALEAAPREAPAAAAVGEERLPLLKVAAAPDELFRGKGKSSLEAALPGYLLGCRWFGGKARTLQSVRLRDVVPMAATPRGPKAYLALLTVEYVEGEPETYALPLALARGEQIDEVLADSPQAAIARVENAAAADQPALLFDALWDTRFCEDLLDSIGRRRRFKGSAGELEGSPTRAFRRIRGPVAEPLEPAILKGEQSNTSVVYSERLILKLFRRLGEGLNPDLEIGRFLTEKRFPNVPPVAGSLEYRRKGGEPMTVAILHGFVPNEGDAWRYTLDELNRYFERVVTLAPELEPPPQPEGTLLDMADGGPPELAADLIGTYLETARLLGQRTAEMHVTLASADDPAFAPEPLSPLYCRSLYQSMRSMSTQSFQLLHKRMSAVDDRYRADAEEVLRREGEIMGRFRALSERPQTGMRIRCHGDFHLGQVLYTGDDFVIIDFEGEPTRPLGERRLKRSPLRDVAGMIRSFHYAAYAALDEQAALGLVSPERALDVEAWAGFWYTWTSAVYLKAYLAVAPEAPWLPRDRDRLQALLDAFLLEKAVYEIGYELNNRPDWLKVPLRGALQLLCPGAPAG